MTARSPSFHPEISKLRLACCEHLTISPCPALTVFKSCKNSRAQANGHLQVGQSKSQLVALMMDDAHVASAVDSSSVAGTLPGAAQDAASDAATPDTGNKSRRDTNQARNEAQRELLVLRNAVSALEHELQASRSAKRRRLESNKERYAAVASGGMVWRETAMSQLKQRVKAEKKNLRLRKKVELQRAMLWHLRSKLLGNSASEFGGYSFATKLPPFNMKRIAVIQELMRRVDAIYACASPSEDATIGDRDSFDLSNMRPTMVSSRRLVAKRLLPFDVHATGNAAWDKFTGVLRLHATSSFSNRSTENDYNNSVSTVIEYLDMRLTHEDANAEFRVTQVMRRYAKASCEVIIWESVVEPIAINDCTCRVDGASFRETGRVFIRPYVWEESETTSPPVFSVTEMSYAVEEPKISNAGDPTDMSRFMLRSAAPSISAMYLLIENLLLRGR